MLPPPPPERVWFLPAERFAQAAARAFAQHRDAVAAVLPFAVIEHVGTTGVGRGLTKGDVDLCIRVPPARFADADAALAALYPRNTGSDRTPTFSAFEAAQPGPPSVGVQLCAVGGPEDTFVEVRELLRARPDLVAAYDDLKRRHEGGLMHEYRACKGVFMDALTRLVRTDGAESPQGPGPT